MESRQSTGSLLPNAITHQHHHPIISIISCKRHPRRSRTMQIPHHSSNLLRHHSCPIPLSTSTKWSPPASPRHHSTPSNHFRCHHPKSQRIETHLHSSHLLLSRSLHHHQINPSRGRINPACLWNITSSSTLCWPSSWIGGYQHRLTGTRHPHHASFLASTT